MQATLIALFLSLHLSIFREALLREKKCAWTSCSIIHVYPRSNCVKVLHMVLHTSSSKNTCESRLNSYLTFQGCCISQTVPFPTPPPTLLPGFSDVLWADSQLCFEKNCMSSCSLKMSQKLWFVPLTKQGAMYVFNTSCHLIPRRSTCRLVPSIDNYWTNLFSILYFVIIQLLKAQQKSKP